CCRRARFSKAKSRRSLTAVISRTPSHRSVSIMGCSVRGSASIINGPQADKVLARDRRESRWPWKWKFRTTDTRVRFNPDKFGWPWMPDTCSWVVPTAFSVLALRQGVVCCRSPEARFRVIRGIEMLIDRVCLNGGWNAGNGVVYGVDLWAHVDATAIALLPLRGEPQRPAITRSL